MRRPIESHLTQPTYRLNEAAELAGVSTQTVSYWFRGRAGSERTPLFSDRLRDRNDEVRLSFLEVSETIVAALFRRNGASMTRLRTAREFTRARIGSEFPLATRQFKLASRRILLDLEEQSPSRRSDDLLVDFSLEAGHNVLPFYFTEALERFDYSDDPADDRTDGWAQRYHPHGRDAPLVIDPVYGSGRLTVAGTNIRAAAVFARIAQGYSAEDITDDLRLPIELAKAVIKFKTAA